MVGRRWLEELRTESLRCGLPDEYVERLGAELFDHLEDLKEETMLIGNVCDESMIESRLGDVERVVETARAEHRWNRLRRSKLTAFAVFALSPIPLFYASWVATMLLLFGVLWGVGFALQAFGVTDATIRNSLVSTPFTPHLIRTVLTAAVMIPSVALAFYYCRVSRRTGRTLLWSVVGCCSLAVAAGLVNQKVTLSPEPGQSALFLAARSPQGAWQWAQAAVPLAVAGVCVCRDPKRSRQTVSLN